MNKGRNGALLTVDHSLLITSSHWFLFCLSFKAWLTEIHEYAQKDVVIMLLGNKVRRASWFQFYHCSVDETNSNMPHITFHSADKLPQICICLGIALASKMQAHKTIWIADSRPLFQVKLQNTNAFVLAL